MQDSVGRFDVMFRLLRVIPRAAKLVTALAAPWALACAGARTAGPNGQPEAVPVFLPGERVECLFEVIGELTVQGPFRARGDTDGGSREALMRGVRLEVGREGMESGADAVMIREVRYEQGPSVARDDTPEIVTVEGLLLSFQDSACVPGG